LALMTVTAAATAGPAGAAVPGTAALTWPEEDLSARMMDGAHTFVARKIAEAQAERGSRWERDFSSFAAYERSVAPNRERLRTVIGAVDARLPAALEIHASAEAPGPVEETAQVRVWRVRWPVLDGVGGAGFWVEPKGNVRAAVIAVPDADQTPEALWATPALRQLAAAGVELLIPVTVSRSKLATDDAALKRSDQTYREWIYRQAFHLGRHVIGYEVQTVAAAVDGLQRRRGAGFPIGIAGYGEGGLVALHAAAVDPRLLGALVSGYFDARDRPWAEPIYRNVWGRAREFGDAEIAGLILPRVLVIEEAAAPTVTGHKGDIAPIGWARVVAEAGRIVRGPAGGAPLLAAPTLVPAARGTPGGPWSLPAVRALASALGVVLTDGAVPTASAGGGVISSAAEADARHLRFVRGIEGHVQRLVRQADEVREKFFLHAVMPELAESRWSTAQRHPTHAPDKFIARARAFRERFYREAMGRFDEPLLPANARSRKVAETAAWTAYDVVLDVFPELFAWGMLVVPKGIVPGERRPVVVCQHGRNGRPRDLLDQDGSGYNRTAARLAERGFVTFAPHNLYRGEDRYRWLSRKANAVHASLFSFIIPQHEQILKWLATQPYVDPARIGFYGLSYGGETAVRVPPILEGYALSICSGDFNQWTRKVAATDLPFSFMRTVEWEMPYWNLGHTFDYAEMAYLMVPRPFMVERGHHDRVSRDSWVAHEYAKVRWLYAQLGLADRTEIEFFQGGHSMNQEGAFAFLHRHLRWPPPAAGR
jgi:dienelactone hydrolase